MIIGKSITASGKGLKPELIITSLENSTVTISENSQVKYTVAFGEGETQKRIKINLNSPGYSYIVLNTFTQYSVSITVDTIKLYSADVSIITS